MQVILNTKGFAALGLVLGVDLPCRVSMDEHGIQPNRAVSGSQPGSAFSNIGANPLRQLSTIDQSCRHGRSIPGRTRTSPTLDHGFGMAITGGTPMTMLKVRS